MVQGQENIFAEETAENDYYKDLKTVDYLQKYVAKYNQIVAPYIKFRKTYDIILQKSYEFLGENDYNISYVPNNYQFFQEEFNMFDSNYDGFLNLEELQLREI